jgi:hypothetical protein
LLPDIVRLGMRLIEMSLRGLRLLLLLLLLLLVRLLLLLPLLLLLLSTKTLSLTSRLPLLVIMLPAQARVVSSPNNAPAAPHQPAPPVLRAVPRAQAAILL